MRRLSVSMSACADPREEEKAKVEEMKGHGVVRSVIEMPLKLNSSLDIGQVAPALAPREMERLLQQQQLNCSTQTSNSEYDSLADMLGSREQRIVPMMTSSWLESVNKYSELEGDSAIFASQDSLEVLNWNTHDCGRAGSPLRFDHEEMLGINDQDEERDSGRGDSLLSPSRPPHNDTDLGNTNLRLKYSETDICRLRGEFEQEFEAKQLKARASCRCAERKREEDDGGGGKGGGGGCEWRLKSNRLMEEKQRLTEQIARLQKSHEEMKSVISEYESTIQKLIEGKEVKSSKSKEVFIDVTKERDQAVDDLRSVETAFSDLHRRYEKTKQAVDAYKKNEDILRTCIEDLQEKLKKQEEKFSALKEQAENKLAKANKEIELMRRRSDSDVTVMNAALRKAEVQIESLQQTIEQKVKENKELSSICDELISKVGLNKPTI